MPATKTMLFSRLNLFTFLLLLSIVSISFSALAQTDSVIMHDKFSSELNTSSPISEERRYNFYPLSMKKGDKLYVLFESKDFETRLILQDSSGKHREFADSKDMTEVKFSKASKTITANETGVYYIILTTKQPGKTGKFTMESFYYTAALNKVNSSSSFCDKLKYITSNASSDFEFIKGEERLIKDPSGILAAMSMHSYIPTIQLTPQFKSEISESRINSSYTFYHRSTDLAELKKHFSYFEKQINSCLKDASMKVKGIPNMDARAFVCKTEWELSERRFNEAGKNYYQKQLYKVTLGIDKVGHGDFTTIDKNATIKYDLNFRIDSWEY